MGLTTLTSLQVCMDSSDWLQGSMNEENLLMDSSSSPSSGDILTCPPPLMERRLRPQHDPSLKCPRCDSSNTKFCYYNNYSLSQPRYFCKSCRRYWTKGGTLRNIPVGGGCRKNKKSSSSSSSSKKQQEVNQHQPMVHNPVTGDPSNGPRIPTDLRLSFPELQFSHLYGNPMMENDHNVPRQIEFMERGYEGNLGNLSGSIIPMGHDFMGRGAQELGVVAGLGDMGAPFGFSSFDGNNGDFLNNYHHRLMLPYNGQEHDFVPAQSTQDVKPNTRLLSLDWQQDQGCSDVGKDSFGYLNSIGSWGGLMNGYGSSTTNPLV